jgi:hypothetical protein
MLLSKSNRSFYRGSAMILGFTFMISQASIADNQSLRDTVINTSLSALEPIISSSVTPHEIFYSTPELFDSASRVLQINKLNTQDFKQEKKYCHIPKQIFIAGAPMFCINGSYLLLQDDETLELNLFKNKSDTFKFICKIIPPERTKYFEMLPLGKEQFLLIDLYNHHPSEDKFNTSLSVYEPSLNRISITIHPDLPCIAWSHFPKKWVTLNDSSIFLSEPCGTIIHEYDHSLKPKATIELPAMASWKNLPANRFPFETSPDKIHPKLLIDELKTINRRVNRIENITAVDDSLLIISCTGADSLDASKKIAFLYNPKTKQFWAQPITCFSTTAMNSSSKINSSIETILNSAWSGISRSITIDNDSFIPQTGLTQEENEQLKNKYYETHDPEFIFKAYTTHLDQLLRDKGKWK